MASVHNSRSDVPYLTRQITISLQCIRRKASTGPLKRTQRHHVRQKEKQKNRIESFPSPWDLPQDEVSAVAWLEDEGAIKPMSDVNKTGTVLERNG